MPGESVPTGADDEPERRPARMTGEMDDNVQAKPWPFYLDQDVGMAGGDGPHEEKGEDLEQANPWPYHGPPSGDDAPSATIYSPPPPKAPQRKASSSSLVGGVAVLVLGGGGDHPGEPTLRLSPEQRGEDDAARPGEREQSSYPAALRVSRPDSDSTASPPPGIRPYCPPADTDNMSAGGRSSHPSGAPPPKSPDQSAAVTYKPYRPPSTSSVSGTTRPQSPSVMGAAPHHFYTPLSPTIQMKSPSTQNLAVVVPGAETQSPGQNPSIRPHSPPPPPSKDSPVLSIQSPASTPVNMTSPPQSPPSAIWAQAQAPLAQASPTIPATASVPPCHTPSPQIPPSPASLYNIQQATYAPSPLLSAQARPQVPHANTDPSQPAYASVSPHLAPGWPGSHPRPGQSSPPLPSPHPPQPIYETQMGQPKPPLPGGKPPPPLPPRRPNVLHGGFGGGLSNVGNFPPPPKTHYNPLHPPRPVGGGTSSASLFSASSARKWFDKTSQVLESKLESVLQGPSGPAYRPAYMTVPPPQGYPPGQQTRGMSPAGYGRDPGPWGPGSTQLPPQPGWRGS
ncbi:hypothetical protein ED733_001607 [Metarhizium rileyi]|uniref:Uncharacterized protein n=1 Tax=Metarhizium rileyi (strain RCEF 4871) TaxID=1649241 RepID=A0A5C6GAK6_METRR|nr:hypothetical protein ED733_001607 [Metarhizium rileyi]